MQKSYFHNGKIIKETIEERVSPQTSIISPKKIVDINKLLNRVKIEKQNKKKRKLHFNWSSLFYHSNYCCNISYLNLIL